MQNRRDFIAGSVAVASALPLAACARHDMADYRAAEARLRARLAENPDMRELIRFASLAPNGHNSQPWRFALNGNNVSIMPDLTRRTPVVDPDDHHLYVSLGCAAENLLIAGAAHGKPGQMLFFPEGNGRIEVGLDKGTKNESLLYAAIPMRQSTRSRYDGRAVPFDHLKQLEDAARVDGVSLTIITDDKRREELLEQLILANTAQVENPAFVRELKHWIRFNPTEALATRDGLFSKSSGNPSVPTVVGKLLFGQFFSVESENRKTVEQVQSSSGIAVFTGDKVDRAHWIKVGQSFQRFALMATALNIRHAHINQLVEVPKARGQFAGWLGMAGARPDLVIRFGYAPPMPMSLRRAVTDILVRWEIRE